MKKIAAMILCLSAFVAEAQIYVSQYGSGTQSGVDSNNCQTLAWVNAATGNGAVNWGTGSNQIHPGETIHLVGTFTNELTVAGSGTPGNPTTIHFEPNAMFSAPTLPNNTPWISISGLSNLVIDGGVNGSIQLTDNGTVPANGGTNGSGYNIYGIYAYSINNVTVQNLTISNLYNRQTNTEPIQGIGDGTAIQWSGSGLTVSNCFFTGCQDMIAGGYGNPAGSNLTVIACTLSNFNHGITLGVGQVTIPPLFYNVRIISNTFQEGDMFETSNGIDLGLHRNPIFFFNESIGGIGCISNITIAYNFINSGFKPLSGFAGSGAMFFDFYNNSMASNVMIYNNISTTVAPLSWAGGGGFIAGGGTQVLVANNTAISWQTNKVIGGNSEISVNGTNVYLYNNICVSLNGVSLATYANTNGLTNNTATVASLLAGVWSDYNIYNFQGPNSFQEVVFGNGGSLFQSGLFDSFSQWTNILSGALAAHVDPHSLTASVQLDSNFIPLSTDTVAVGHGTNLTAWGITNDFAGNPRPATGNWTIGAYQITDSSSTKSNIFSGVTAAAVVTGGSGGIGGVAPGIGALVPGGGGNDITSNLLVWYKGNQTSGAAIDSSGNNYSGLFQGGAAWTNGLDGTGAFGFTHNDGLWSSPDAVQSGALAYNGDWTLTFWTYLYNFPGSQNCVATLGSGSGFYVGGASWGVTDGSANLNANSSLTSNQWYFISISKHQGTNYQLYLNGAPNNYGVLGNINVSYLCIGNKGGSSLGMNGAVEDVRLFRNVLSGAQISIMAANGPDDVAATMLAAPTGFQIIGTGP